MPERIVLGGLSLEVIKKDIKNIHLGVYPPDGRVRVAAPGNVRLETLRIYLISKLGWIKEQQRKFRAQEREPARGYVTRESHYLWGKRYLLRVLERDTSPGVEVKPRGLVLRVRPATGAESRKAILEKWFREQVRDSLPPLLRKWEPVLGVAAKDIRIQRMRTKWGSCNPRSRRLLLNSELAKKAPICLEYILVHELIHLLEPTHNERFLRLIDLHLPHWRHYRRELNRAPLSFENWEY
jgi:predicted metal-dependent hydrolase